jgi:hypothetical protein
MHLLTGRVDLPVADQDMCPHRFEALEMEVDRTGADGAAAGQCDPGTAAARQHRTHHQERGPHAADQFVWRLTVADVDRVDGQIIAAPLDTGPEVTTDVAGGSHVVQPRHIA